MNSIVCYDYAGTPLKNLYQWDYNQKILISGVDTGIDAEIHFCHPDSTEALVLVPHIEDAYIVVSIPNILLQQAKPVVIYVFQDFADSGSRTISSLRIPVYPRPRPMDYVYTETEVLCYREIDERLRALEQGGVVGNVDLSAYAKKEELPDTTSDLVNDSGFITRLVSDLANYYAKNETYTRAEIDARISAIPHFSVAVVSALPSQNISDTTIYLLTTGNATGDMYSEWIWANGKWELLGSQRVDLTGYAKEEWVNLQLEGYQPAGNYALKDEIPPVPVRSVNGKTGTVQLSASDVGARPDNWMPTAQDVGALPSTYTPPNQTAEQVGADPKGTATAAVSQHNTADDSHGDIRLELKAINDRLTSFFDSDNQTLDELSEIVAYITNNKSLIDAITTSKVSVADIINNLTTNVANKPLSAAQGVALKALIDAITVPTKVSQLTNDKGYLTEHQDISGKLDASALPTAISTALAQAKASGEFDGEDGQRGTGLLAVTTAPSGYTTAVGGITPKYRMALSTIKTQAGVTEVLLGDTVRYSYYHYSIDYMDASYAYFTERVSIRGSTGATGATGAAGKDYVLTEADKSEIAALVIEMLGGNPIFGIVDENNNIIVSGDLTDGTYSVKYEMEDGSKVNIGNLVLDTNVYYTVTNTLTQCTTNNSATKVVQGSAYSATITAKSGYELKSVTATMGGTAVSVSNGKINIASVTGNIVITAVAEEIKAAYTNLANPSSSDWWADSYLSSDASVRTKAGYAVSNFIGPVNVGDVIYIKGIDLTGTVAEYRCAPYKSDKTLNGSFGTGALSTLGGLSTKPITAVTVTTTGGQFTNNNSDIKYWRIGGKLNGTANDVIITINEPIA